MASFRLKTSVFLCIAEVFLLATAGNAATQASPGLSGPTVTLDKGIFIGVKDLNTSTNNFLGIPFAKPPVGDLRFNLPVLHEPYTGIHNATAFGFACPQQGSGINTANSTAPESEDCLTINVFQPEGIAPGAKLPVAAWIYGGGFELGSTPSFNGGTVVQQSVKLNQPIIYVSMNYRVNAFGFLASKEIKEAGVANMGLEDQRLALRWVQNHITAFGGDPEKVTIWGQSAGAISIGLHLVANGGNTEGLFRGAFMESGSPDLLPDTLAGQSNFDALVQATGCETSPDRLNCLRHAPFDVVKTAVDQTPLFISFTSLRFIWGPSIDGRLFKDSPLTSVVNGQVANVPFITGDCDDEGTAFTMALLNLTTDEEVRGYISSNYLPRSPPADIDRLLVLYPQNPALGSPYDTGDLNQLTPQFKRLASIQGDLLFQAPRRFFLQHRSSKQKTFSFLSKRSKSTPNLGSSHGTDVALAYGQTDFTDYIVNFVHNLDPNGPTVPEWPQYSDASPRLMTLLDGPVPIDLTLDNFREEPLAFMQKVMLVNPVA